MNQAFPDLQELLRLIQQAERKLQGLKKFSSSVVIVGDSGQGKSTLFNFINQLPMKIENINGQFHLVNDLEKLGNMVIATIGVEVTAETKNPAWVEFHDGQKLANIIDLPGFIGTNETNEIVNSACIKHVFKISREVKILFVVDEGKLDDKCDSFRQFVLKPIAEAFPNFFEIEKSIMLVISKGTGKYDDGEAIANKLQQFADKLTFFSPEERKVLDTFTNPKHIFLFFSPPYVLINKKASQEDQENQIKQTLEKFYEKNEIGILLRKIKTDMKYSASPDINVRMREGTLKKIQMLSDVLNSKITKAILKVIESLNEAFEEYKSTIEKELSDTQIKLLDDFLKNLEKFDEVLKNATINYTSIFIFSQNSATQKNIEDTIKKIISFITQYIYLKNLSKTKYLRFSLNQEN